MKNIQVIEPAENCSFTIHAVSDDDFSLLFPTKGQDVEFVEDVAKRLGKREAGKLIVRTTRRRLHKPDVKGIHGTLFIGYPKGKSHFPNKRESDLDGFPRGRSSQ